MSDEKPQVEPVPATDTADAGTTDAQQPKDDTITPLDHYMPRSPGKDDITAKDHYMPAPPVLGLDGK